MHFRLAFHERQNLPRFFNYQNPNYLHSLRSNPIPNNEQEKIGSKASKKKQKIPIPENLNFKESTVPQHLIEEEEISDNKNSAAQRQLDLKSKSNQGSAKEKDSEAQDEKNALPNKIVNFFNPHDPNQERVDQVMKELAKNSDFYKKEEQKLRDNLNKIKQYKNKINKYKQDASRWENTLTQVNILKKQFYKELDISRTWIHIDMDMFFAQVEIRDNPDLNLIPIAVGDKSMIQTTNYLAREKGVKSGMPGFIGQKLCPELTFIKPNYSAYKQISEAFHQILKLYDPQFESQGMDEASLDVTDYLKGINMNCEEGKLFIAQKIQKEIYKQVQLTASCGIAANKLLAKICCGVHKPNGLTYLDFNHEEIEKFMSKLPVRRVPGIGKVNQVILEGLGIKICKELIDHAPEIYINFTKNSFDTLVRYSIQFIFLRSAMGISRNVHDESAQKSIGVYQTFKPIITDYNDFKAKVLAMGVELCERLWENMSTAKIITLELRSVKYELKQRSQIFPRHTIAKKDIINAAMDLLNQILPMDEGCRYIGLRLTNLRGRSKNQKKGEAQNPDQLQENNQKEPSSTGRRISDQSQCQSDNSQNNELIKEGESINPEDVGLFFDRARMNASNRKNVDLMRSQKKLAQESEQVKASEENFKPIQQSGTNILPITSFWQKTTDSSQQNSNNCQFIEHNQLLPSLRNQNEQEKDEINGDCLKETSINCNSNFFSDQNEAGLQPD